MAVLADLDGLRRYVGAATTTDDVLLSERLDSARRHIEGRIYAASVGSDDVEEAILLLASRLYKRRQSPEGTSGFGGEGVVVRILASDPDIRSLLERHADLSDADELTGIGIG